MTQNDLSVDAFKDGEAIFAQWVSPMSLGDLFTNIWAKQAHHFTGGPSEKLDGLLDEQAIDAFLGADVLPAHYLKVVTAEHIFGRHQWATLDTRRDFDAIHIVDQRRLFALFGNGATIIIGAAEGHFQPLKECCDALQAFFGFRVQANIYITPPNAQGLPAHYDDHDVIVAQISGEKDWYIHGCPVSEPTSQQSYQGDRTTKHSDSQIYGLAKGDIFYVPRGWMHEAISKAAHSIHITFGLHQPMLCDVVAELAQKASADQAFRLRRPLPISSQDERVEFSRKISQLIEHASAMMPYGGTVESNPSTPSFLEVLAIEHLTIDNWVQASPNCQPAITHNNNEMNIAHGTQSITFPKFLMPIVDQLLSGIPVQISKLSGLANSNGKIEIAQKMLRAGLLEFFDQDAP